MELVKEDTLVKKLSVENEEFKALYAEHIELDSKISEMSRHHLTPFEEIERKALQKRKLAGKDRMLQLIAEYKQSNN